MRYTVGAVARFAGVSVRTLHHDDDIGLLVPTARSPAGTGSITGSAAAARDRSSRTGSWVDHLRRQHAALTGQVHRLQAMIHTIERTMEAHKMPSTSPPTSCSRCSAMSTRPNTPRSRAALGRHRRLARLAAAHLQHISRWLYDCPPQMHRHLGELYVADPRFTAHYDDQAPGLARYVQDAVTANADRRTSGG